MSNWKILRIGLIVLSSTAALFNPLPDQEVKFPWIAVLIVFLAFPFIAAVAAAILVIFPKSQLQVSRPDWDKSFLDFSHPEHFFHFGAIVMIASGLATIVSTVTMSENFQLYSIVPIAMGAGILSGLSMLVYLSEKRANR